MSEGPAFPNLMIQASAGSGKTHDLVGRYLNLLDAFENPQSIVALTFTRKAAGEFFDRILGALAAAAESDAAAAKAAEEYGVAGLTRQRALRLLRLLADHLHQLSLGTLDSFYARVLRAFPAEFGVSADYEVMDESATLAARREVIDTVLGGLSEDEAAAFHEAFRRATFGSEEKRLISSLEDFVKAYHGHYLGLPAPEGWGGEARMWPDGAWWLGAPAASELESAVDVLETAAIDFENEAKPKKNPAKALRSVIAAVEQSSPGLVPDPGTFVISVLEALDGLRSGGVEELVYSRSKVPLSAPVQAALAVAGQWLLWCEVGGKLEQTQGIHDIVARYEEVYDRAVRRGGRLGFSDVLAILAGVAPVHAGASGGELLLSMNRGAPAIADEDREALRLLVDYRLDGRFQHWLIDEFQDTSRRQWQVLRNLIDEVMFDDSGERSFYYVGDVKQAIFGWRGGDSRLFDEIPVPYEKLPEARRIGRKELDASWRSGPVILRMVNRIFGDAAALAEAVGDAHRAVIDDRWATTWRHHESNRPDRVGFARWITIPKPESAGRSGLPDELRWQVVLGILRELDPVGNGLDCAVLVRRGRSAYALADYVRQHSEIPVMVEGRMAVGADHPVATSFAALLRWVAHPGDTLSRAHLRMTPPHVAMSPVKALEWERRTSGRLLKMIHDEGFGEAFQWWSGELRTALADGLGEFSEHRCEQIAEACRHFDESGNRSVDDFLDHLEASEASDLPAPGTVQLMTIHKAKGLTFDAVIIADIEGNAITSAGQLTALTRGVEGDEYSDDDWLVLPPKKQVALTVEPLASAYRHAEMDAAFEELCNLYVALTRARYANFVVSSQPPKSKNAGEPNSSPPALLEATLSDGEPEIEVVGGLEVETRYQDGDPNWIDRADRELGDERAPQPPPLEPVAGCRRFPPRRRRLPSGPGDGRPFGDPELWFGEQNARATGFGSAVHALFECLSWLDDLSDEERTARWTAALAEYPEFADEARAEVERSLEVPEIRALFQRPEGTEQKGAEVWQEKRFEMIVDEDEWLSGVFDRVNRFADRAQIIDFKTNRVDSEEAIAKAVEHYRPQMQSYRQALARLTGLSPDAIDCLLVFTRPGRVIPIDPPLPASGRADGDDEVVQGELEL